MQPLESPRYLRFYSVYDFEWIPGTLHIRLCGLYDGYRYTAFHTIDEFLGAVLTRDNHNRWFWAHYGGNADVMFVFEKLMERKEFHIRAIFSSSSAIMVIVKHKRTKLRWIFLDSFWLIKERLAKIGEKMGRSKTGPTDDMDAYARKCWYQDVGWDELRDYNEQDCLILYEAISMFEQTVLKLGGQLRITIASTALDLFLRRYLKEPIPILRALNRWSRMGYVASRVEPIEKYVRAHKYYDINSSFPYSMTFPLPGKVQSITNTLPSKGLYLADCTVRVPEFLHIPPLPYRGKNHVFYPVGEWRGYFFQSDIDVLHQAGGDVIANGDVIVLEPFMDLAQYAEDVYEYKRQAEGFERQIYKYLLNSLYGKFAEQEDKQTVHINPPTVVIERLEQQSSFDGSCPSRRAMLRPGVWVEKREGYVDHAHVALSAAITSYSRQWVWEWMVKARECYYVDTDGVAVSPDTDFPVSDKLGGMKLEETLSDGLYLQPKLYRKTTVEGKVIYKAKGFSLGTTDKERKENFETLAAGREIEITRMMRLRESFKRGINIPFEDVIEKRFQHPAEKRCFAKDGTSRPWHVDEIGGILDEE